MAGNYPDEPGHRIAWDRDGSLCTTVNLATGAVVARTLTQMRSANSEDQTGAAMAGHIFAVLFPIPMDLVSAFFRYSVTTQAFEIQTSKDSTNGMDGLWSSQELVGRSSAGRTQVAPDYREGVYKQTLLTGGISQGLRGIRLVASAVLGGSITAFHLYGQPAVTATADRLALWHPTLDVRLPPAYFDWGNVPRSSSADRPFRVKNLSADLFAREIDVYIEALTPGNPSIAAMHTLSDNGGATFAANVPIPVLAPGATGPVLTLRRVVPAAAQLSTFSARIAADVTLWSST